MAPSQSMGVRGTSLALVAGLLAIGLFAASPFLCRRLVGTGESYNYSLSVADSLAQMRAGNVPPLVGQTLYAFNGRIHPLRNAPYLYYLAAAVDVASFHRLTFWEIQNVSLGLSLVAAGLACYIGLRRGVECPPVWAFLLSGIYGLSPALLGAAYSYDLFMTVHASVFVPLAVGASMRGCLRPSFSADAWLAAALAATWLAHPPVALWLTFGAVLVRGICFVLSPSWAKLASGLAAIVLAGLLCAFVFFSVSAVNADLKMVGNGPIDPAVATAMADGVRTAFPSSVLPVGRAAHGPGDLQLGFVAWLVLAATALALLRTRERVGRLKQEWWAAGVATAYSVFLLVLLLPIPILTLFLWRHLPAVVISVTNLWPMQRLYLVLLPFSLFGAAIVLPRGWRELRLPTWVGIATVLICAAWIVYESTAFLARGFGNRWSLATTESSYWPSNLDLTVTSYAYYGVPPTFVYGVVDPEFEFRLLRGGTDEIDSPFLRGEAGSPVIVRGSLNGLQPSVLTLQPGRRYLLAFDFKAAPVQGFLQIVGPLIHRTYDLPSAGPGRGFGMVSGQRNSISLWTDGKVPERVELHLTLGGGQIDPKSDFADFSLREVNLNNLAVRLNSLFPMRFTVDAPESGCTVETPRCFLSGYTATANGLPVFPVSSADRMVMVPVPAGHSVIEMRYQGPPAVRIAFWGSAGAWLFFLLWRLSGSRLPISGCGRLVGVADALRKAAPRRKAIFATVVLSALGLGAWRYHLHKKKYFLDSAGPIQIQFTLPYGKKNINQPLLTTGHPGAGVVVFVNCLDERHVRIGADVWGHLFESVPLEVDFSKVQSLVVSDSSLFPSDHPKVKALTSAEIELARNHVLVELNGHRAINAESFAYETTLAEIQVGAARFGSIVDPRFLGTIVGVRRLPFTRHLSIPWGQHILMKLRFPDHRTNETEPLLTCSSGPKVQVASVTYLAGRRIRITSSGADGGGARSAEIAYDPSVSHQIDFFAGEVDDRTLNYEIACAFDEIHLLGSDRMHSPGIPSLAVCGLNDPTVPGVKDRFTGSQMEASVITDGPATGTSFAFGPVHMILSFPKNKSGRNEPLLATGRNGAGDLVFVTYTDQNHVRIGCDHWGVGGLTSDPIAIDYTVPHEIWIASPALAPGKSSALGSKIEILLDGKIILTSTVEPFPASPSEVTIVKNQIGGSSADPEFSGIVHFVERTGETNLPPAR